MSSNDEKMLPGASSSQHRKGTSAFLPSSGSASPVTSSLADDAGGGGLGSFSGPDGLRKGKDLGLRSSRSGIVNSCIKKAANAAFKIDDFGATSSSSTGATIIGRRNNEEHLEDGVEDKCSLQRPGGGAFDEKAPGSASASSSHQLVTSVNPVAPLSHSRPSPTSRPNKPSLERRLSDLAFFMTVAFSHPPVTGLLLVSLTAIAIGLQILRKESHPEHIFPYCFVLVGFCGMSLWYKGVRATVLHQKGEKNRDGE
ncbi:unnamed protein product [Amoebophrya sp. A25]|nr:unnamed protein product [Amoebophrya sp. A25]|eukprot:GSA25T00026041001.1